VAVLAAAAVSTAAAVVIAVSIAILVAAYNKANSWRKDMHVYRSGHTVI
jgi:hypothetical protein